MKAKVVFPAVGNEANWRPGKYDPTKRQTTIVVEAQGKTYACYATEGTSAWDLPKGSELEVEIVSEPSQPGKHGFAKLAGQARPNTFKPRVFSVPDAAIAKAACDYVALLHKAVQGRLPEADTATVAAYVAAIFSRTT